MRRPWHTVVVVPARDEEQLVARCVRSIRLAAAMAAPVTSTEIVVVADSCLDGTAARATRALGRRGVVATASLGTAGGARRLGVELALSRTARSRDRIWIASTDADTTVPPTWLLTQLRLAATAVHAVAGVVRLASGSELDATLANAFSLAYTTNRDGTHSHVHGANLGVRADAYLASGGWSDLATGEDHDLWKRLALRHDIRHTDASFVRTSARRSGRAPLGFADELVALDGVAVAST